MPVVGALRQMRAELEAGALLTIERLDNAGDGALQLNLQPAPFAQLLRWFTVLQEQGVQIAEAGLDRADGNKVAARLSLRERTRRPFCTEACPSLRYVRSL